MSHARRTNEEQELVRRICSEFVEMPCLRLTCAQAQRLFGLTEDTCRCLLDALVADKFLSRNANGMYVMRSSGPAGVALRRRERQPITLRRTA
jgi:hypothetical protein